MESTWPLITQILIDTVMLLAVGLPTPILIRANIIFRRGFFCHDEDIMYPAAHSTIDKRLWHPIECLIVICLIILIEYLREYKSQERIVLWRLRIPKWCYNAYCVLVSFAFGILSAILITAVMKSTVGRLRPYFFAKCTPNINCSLPENQHVYHTDYECTNKKYSQSIRLSFPSGHANFAMYYSIFLIIYLGKRMTWTVVKLLKNGLQVVMLLMALFVGVSRVSDYKHQWSDVLAGFFVGGSCAVLVSMNLFWVSDVLKEKSTDSSSAMESRVA